MLARTDLQFRRGDARRMIRSAQDFASESLPLRSQPGARMAHARQEVLLVEDDESMRQALARMLIGAGYEVKAFDSAEALLDLLPAGLLREGSACVVCDVRLPGLCGFELQRRLAEMGPTPPWIFMTAHDSQAVREQAERVAATYLLKPFEGRGLLTLIAGVIDAP
jgi:FixJ family two-component response regulator